MSLEQYELLLENCAETGEIDYAQWPAILQPLINRLTSIAHNDFPVPRPYPIINPVLPSQRPSEPDRFLDRPPTLPSNTPNTPRTLPPVPPFPGSGSGSGTTTHISNSQPQDLDTEESKNTTATKGQLPLEVIQLLDQSLNHLRHCFPEKPPHTIQRLSELALHPRKHYRTLPAWLRALDRVVSVSSGADIFPLSDQPPNIGPTATNGILNGAEGGGILFANSSNDTRNGYDRDSLGSDESLGGALLTPIPWLKDSDLSRSTGSTGSTGSTSSTSKIESWQEGTEPPDDPDTDSEMLPMVEESMAVTAAHAEAIAAVAHEHTHENIPEREDGAVTQGELIRMEQEAGVVPVPHGDVHRIDDDGIELDLEDEGDNMPHARGPDVVGTVDMGKVEGQERQVRISSPPEERVVKVDANDAQDVLDGGKSENTEGRASGEEFVKVEKEDVPAEKESDDGDIVLVDADEAVKDAVQQKEEGIDEKAVDTTAP